jgi:hypothetical protein
VCCGPIIGAAERCILLPGSQQRRRRPAAAGHCALPGRGTDEKSPRAVDWPAPGSRDIPTSLAPARRRGGTGRTRSPRLCAQRQLSRCASCCRPQLLSWGRAAGRVTLRAPSTPAAAALPLPPAWDTRGAQGRRRWPGRACARAAGPHGGAVLGKERFNSGGVLPNRAMPRGTPPSPHPRPSPLPPSPSGAWLGSLVHGGPCDMSLASIPRTYSVLSDGVAASDFVRQGTELASYI